MSSSRPRLYWFVSAAFLSTNDKHSIRSRDAKRILKYLDERKGGASVGMIGRAVGLHWHRVISLLKFDLEPTGEVWRKGDADGGWWHLTSKYLTSRDKDEITRDLKQELEREIFGAELPSWLGEFAAGIHAGLSIEDAWHFAQRKIAEAHPELRTGVGEVGAET